MLQGQSIRLRPVREADLELLFLCLTDIRNRGEYFPIKVRSETWLRKQYQDSGFWEEHNGLLLITDAAATVIGHIEFFKPAAYLDAYELSYLLYDPAERGKGVMSEAVSLLTQYLFNSRKVNRIQLIIHPDNRASRRVAEKNGFSHEGAMRSAWYHRGQYHDVEVYALLRREHDARRNGEVAKIVHEL